MNFFEAQARHRQAAQRWALACAALALAVAAVAGAILSLPVWIVLFLVFRSLEVVAIVIAAGTGLTLLLWLALRRALHRDGGLGLALAIGARPPRPQNLEERRLENVLQEMAIAAGMPAPRLLLLDAGPPNAAVTGRGPEDATVIVTRALLDGFSRDQLQAMLGHATATVANGDPRLGIEALAVIHTFGLLAAIGEAPMNRTMRRAAWRALRSIFGAGSGDAAGRDNTSTQLAVALSPDTIVESTELVETSPLKFVLLLPLIAITLVLKIALLGFQLFVAGPFLWSMLRRRRYLADATTVQFTRQSDPFVSALEKLATDGGIASGLGWAQHLYVVGAITSPERAQQQARDSQDQPLILFGVHPPLAARIRRLRAKA